MDGSVTNIDGEEYNNPFKMVSQPIHNLPLQLPATLNLTVQVPTTGALMRQMSSTFMSATIQPAGRMSFTFISATIHHATSR